MEDGSSSYCQPQNLSGWQNYWKPRKNYSHSTSIRRNNSHDNYKTFEIFEGTKSTGNYTNTRRNFEPRHPPYQSTNQYTPQVRHQGPYVRGDGPSRFFHDKTYSRGRGYRRRGNFKQFNTYNRNIIKSNEYFSFCDHDSTQTFDHSNEEAIDLNCDIISKNNLVEKKEETTVVLNNLVSIKIDDSDGETVCLDEMDHIVPTTPISDDDNNKPLEKNDESEIKKRRIEEPPCEDDVKVVALSDETIPFLEDTSTDLTSQKNSSINKKSDSKHSSLVEVERQKDSPDPRLSLDIEHSTERTILLGIFEWEKHSKEPYEKMDKHLEQIQELEVTEITPKKTYNVKDPRARSDFYKKHKIVNGHSSKQIIKCKVKKKIKSESVSISIRTKEHHQKIKTSAPDVKEETVNVKKDKNSILSTDEIVILRHHKGPVSKYSCFVSLPRVDEYNEINSKNDSIRTKSSSNNDKDDYFDFLDKIDTKQSFLSLMDKEKKEQDINIETTKDRNICKKSENHRLNGVNPNSNAVGASRLQNETKTPKIPSSNDVPTVKKQENSIKRSFFQKYDESKKTPTPSKQKNKRKIFDEIEKDVQFSYRTDIKKKLYDAGNDTDHDLDRIRVPSRVMVVSKDPKPKPEYFRQKQLTDLFGDDLSDLTMGEPSTIAKRRMSCEDQKRPGKIRLRRRTLACTICLDCTNGGDHNKKDENSLDDHQRPCSEKISKLRDSSETESPSAEQLMLKSTNKTSDTESLSLHNIPDLHQDLTNSCHFDKADRSQSQLDLELAKKYEHKAKKNPFSTVQTSDETYKRFPLPKPSDGNRKRKHSEDEITKEVGTMKLKELEVCNPSMLSVDPEQDSSGKRSANKRKQKKICVISVTNVTPVGDSTEDCTKNKKQIKFSDPPLLTVTPEQDATGRCMNNRKQMKTCDRSPVNVTPLHDSTEKTANNKKRMEICDPSLLKATSEQDATGKSTGSNSKQMMICDLSLLDFSSLHDSTEKSTNYKKQKNICDLSLLVRPEQNSTEKSTAVNRKQIKISDKLPSSVIADQVISGKNTGQRRPSIDSSENKQSIKTDKAREDTAKHKIKRLRHEENLARSSDKSTGISNENRQSISSDEDRAFSVNFEMKVLYTQKYNKEQELFKKPSAPERTSVHSDQTKQTYKPREVKADQKQKNRGSQTQKTAEIPKKKPTKLQKLKLEEYLARKNAKKYEQKVVSNEIKQSSNKNLSGNNINQDIKAAGGLRLVTEQNHTRKHAIQEISPEVSKELRKTVQMKKSSEEFATEETVNTATEEHPNKDEQNQPVKNNTESETIETITQEILSGGTSLNVIHIEETEVQTDNSCDDIFKILNDSSITLLEKEGDQILSTHETCNNETNEKSPKVDEINNNKANATFFALPETLPDLNMEVVSDLKLPSQDYQRATAKVVLFEEVSELNDIELRKGKIVKPYIDLTGEEEDCDNLCNVLITNVSTEVSVQCIKNEEFEVIKMDIDCREKDVAIVKKTLDVKEAVISNEENAEDNVSEIKNEDMAVPVSAEQTIVKDSLQNVTSHRPSVYIPRNSSQNCGNPRVKRMNRDTPSTIPIQPHPIELTEKDLSDITNVFYGQVFEILRAYAILKKQYENMLMSIQEITQMRPSPYISMANEKDSITSVIKGKLNLYSYYLLTLVNRIPENIARTVFTMYINKLSNLSLDNSIKIFSVLNEFVEIQSWNIYGSFPQFKNIIQAYHKQLLTRPAPPMTEQQILATRQQIARFLELTKNLSANSIPPAQYCCRQSTQFGHFTPLYPPSPYQGVPASNNPHSQTPNHYQQGMKKGSSQVQATCTFYPPMSIQHNASALNNLQSPSSLSHIRHPFQNAQLNQHTNNSNTFHTQNRNIGFSQSRCVMGPPNVTVGPPPPNFTVEPPPQTPSTPNATFMPRSALRNLAMAVEKIVKNNSAILNNCAVVNSPSLFLRRNISPAEANQASPTSRIVEQPKPSETLQMASRLEPTRTPQYGSSETSQVASSLEAPRPQQSRPSETSQVVSSLEASRPPQPRSSGTSQVAPSLEAQRPQQPRLCETSQGASRLKAPRPPKPRSNGTSQVASCLEASLPPQPKLSETVQVASRLEAPRPLVENLTRVIPEPAPEPAPAPEPETSNRPRQTDNLTLGELLFSVGQKVSVFKVIDFGAQAQNTPVVDQTKDADPSNCTIEPDIQHKDMEATLPKDDGVDIIDLTKMETDDVQTKITEPDRCVISTGDIVGLMMSDFIVKNEEIEGTSDEHSNRVRSNDECHGNDLGEDVKTDLIKTLTVKQEDGQQSSENEVIDLTWLDDIPLKEELSDDVETDKDYKEWAPPIPSEHDEAENADGQAEQILNRSILENRQCFCGKPAEYLCYCNTVMYCSQDCQIKHWSQHQKTCSSTTYLRY